MRHFNLSRTILTLMIAVCSLSRLQAQDSIVSIAGTGLQGYSGDNGPATSAQLSNPNGIATDAPGNIYIADYSNNKIRKIDAVTGFITTVVDTGVSGYGGDNGAAVSAKVHFPLGLFIDGAGNIYISDSYNHRVRKVNAGTAVITTIAGTGTYGYTGDGQLAVNAQLNTPAGVFVDAAGNVYITDAGNNVIRKIDASSGIITTVAGNGTSSFSGDGGPATSAALSLLEGKCFVDAAGNIYIPDGNNCVIRKVTAATGVITTVAGSHANAGHYTGDNGLATSAGMSGTIAVLVDAKGDMYISDCNNHVIRKVTASTGIITTIAGGITGAYDGSATLATNKHIYYIWDMTVDADGNLLLADFGWDVIWKLMPCVPNGVTVSGTILKAVAKHATYQWIDCDNGKAPIGGEVGQIFSPSHSGDYAVIVVRNGCTDTSACFAKYATGINETLSSEGISIYPNPTSGIFKVTTSEVTAGGSIEVYDILGSCVYRSAFDTKEVNIDLRSRAAGIYTVMTHGNGAKLMHKVVVQQ